MRELTEGYGKKRDLDREALERMVFYAQTGQCRWHVLLEHLEGESPLERCEHCDNCRRIRAHEAVVEELLRQAPADAEPAHERNADTAGKRLVDASLILKLRVLSLDTLKLNSNLLARDDVCACGVSAWVRDAL